VNCDISVRSSYENVRISHYTASFRLYVRPSVPTGFELKNGMTEKVRICCV